MNPDTKFQNSFAPQTPNSKEMTELLEITVAEKASDLHLTVGQPPILRINGQLVPLSKRASVTGALMEQMTFSLLNEAQKEKLLSEQELDFSYNIEDRARFRGNVFYTMGQLSIALRLIPQKIQTIEELNLPSAIHQFARATQGFVVVAGPSGHGKSTTLAALIDTINIGSSSISKTFCI